MSLPNTLTISRIIITCFFIFTVVQEGFFFKFTALILFCFASITDFFDGYLARKYDEVTDFGKIMDPLADKFLMLTAFLILVSLEMISVWLFLIIFIREIGVSALRWYAQTRGQILVAEKLGKYKTVIQIWTVFIVLVFLTLQETTWGRGWSDLTLGRWQMLMDCSIMCAVLITLVSGVSFFYKNGGIFDENTSY